MKELIAELIKLSREIGREDRQLSILGEGNTSVKITPNQFAIKASGACLATLEEQDVTVCESGGILSLLEQKRPSDEAVDQALLESRAGGEGRKPSTETLFHAWLLTLPDIRFVGHCHSQSANQILCSPRARDFAERRLFPDEVVCCGPASVFVPYVDPGLILAREIRERTVAFMQQHDQIPRLVLLQNHGIIALGATARSVLACLLMAHKAASIFMGAAALGGPNFMPSQQVERIFSRPDEAYRKRQMNI